MATNVERPSSPRSRAYLWIVLFLAVVALGIGGYVSWAPPSERPSPALPKYPLPPEASSEQVHQFCGLACHSYPPPNIFPRSAWRKELRQAYDLFRDSGMQIDFPSLEGVARYYEKRAPEELPPLKISSPTSPIPLNFEKIGFFLPDESPYPGVTHVHLGHLFTKDKWDIVVCDSRHGQVLALQPYTKPPAWKILGEIPAPAHAEVVDLDGDGIKDVLVARLGSFAANNDRAGGVIWLRGTPEGKFIPVPLLKDVGRVADVQAADFRKNGKLDLVVAVFGWRELGEILYLENHTIDWAHPDFRPRVLDSRHGTVRVAVADLNNDGLPDVTALISQEHETVAAFLNQSKGNFRTETIYSAPHPAYGSSGIQIVDLNQDGKPDVLYTNGDILDAPYILKPYHGIQWLENQGEFPFEHHAVTPMYGAMAALAGDFQGRGRLDIVAVSCLPPELFPTRKALNLDAALFLETRSKGYLRHSLEKVNCDHFTCAVGDVDGDGKLDLVTGNFSWSNNHKIADAVVIWKNLGAKK